MTEGPNVPTYPGIWYTPNTYDTNFMPPPSKPGVYLITLPDFENGILVSEILYVGSAKRLKERYKSHEVLSKAKERHGYVQFYFRVEDDYMRVEKQLIKTIQPRYNTQWR